MQMWEPEAIHEVSAQTIIFIFLYRSNPTKYTNTVLVKFEERSDMCYIFEKVMVRLRGPQKQCSQVADMQIEKYKYNNTQIQFR